MYESIVVGADGSESAGIAVERARATALQLQAFRETTTATSEPIAAGTVALDASGTRRRLPASLSCVRTERGGRLRAAQIAAAREPQAPRGAQMPVARPAAAAGPRPA
jgi:nucleotide-binding universal stress UspA family protein